MTVYAVDPLHDPRWAEFLDQHPHASVFHTKPWLEALLRTYQYEPLVLSTSAPRQEINNGLVFSQINSRLTGRRLVSLPFCDHCEPLVSATENLEELLDYLVCEQGKGRGKYIELRPLRSRSESETAFHESQVFYFHTLDLGIGATELFRGCHRDSIQRKIRRAEREALTYEEGQSERLLNMFYDLHLATRRRQGLAPQPLDWFRNLRDCMGDRLKIRVAAKDGRPIASILTLRYKDRLTYKYGCSDGKIPSTGRHASFVVENN